jgi:hypothetical protein
VSAFYYPVRGIPTNAAEAIRTRRPYSATGDGRIYRPIVSVRVGRTDGRVPPLWVRLQIDTAADCIVLDGAVAAALLMQRPPGTADEPFRTAAGGIGAWLADVQLHLGLPTDRDSFDWMARVAFAAEGAFSDRVRSGVLGIGGGLERFSGLSLVLSPDGLAMPSVTLFTP